MQNISMTPEGIQKNLRSFKPLDALCEYIWNGFDAGADKVSILLHTNEFDMINMISVLDNGTGIAYEDLEIKFKPFNDSQKAGSSQKNNHTLPHGRKGIGRLTFFAFAQKARWETVYHRDGQNYQYYIDMDKDSLNQYDDNGGNDPIPTDKETGTIVVFTQIQTFSREEIIDRIKEEFFWFLELHPNKKIYIDEDAISYDDFVEQRIPFSVDDEESLKHKYKISIVQWKRSLGNEYSKFYFITSLGDEIYKEATKLNKKSDEFYHSVYIQSDYFDSFYFEKEDEGQTNIFPNRNEDEYRFLMEKINEELVRIRRAYLKMASDLFINKLVDSNIYPEYREDNLLDSYRKQEMDHLVTTLYAAQPKIFTGLNDTNKKITLQLLNLIMNSEDKHSLFSVLKQVVDLDEDEMKELAEVLKYTSLSNITRLVKLIQDRQRVIQMLKELVFDKDLFAKEVPHIQDTVENHYWLFGEQYNLITAAEPDFTLALKGLIKATTGVEEDVDIDHEDKNKEMDIFMVRQDHKGNITENVVVELKRPTVALGEKQLSQVKKYLQVIKKDARFNMGNVKWTFFLVGNKFDTSGFIEGEMESNISHGENQLVYWRDNGLTKIYVLKWSELFDVYSKRHEYLLEKLKLEESLWIQKHHSADEIVAEINATSAVMPGPLVPKKAL